MATPNFPHTWKLLKTIFAYACAFAFLVGMLVTANHVMRLYPIVFFVGVAWVVLMGFGCWFAMREDKRRHEKPLNKGHGV